MITLFSHLYCLVCLPFLHSFMHSCLPSHLGNQTTQTHWTHDHTQSKRNTDKYRHRARETQTFHTSVLEKHSIPLSVQFNGIRHQYASKASQRVINRQRDRDKQSETSGLREDKQTVQHSFLCCARLHHTHS